MIFRNRAAAYLGAGAAGVLAAGAFAAPALADDSADLAIKATGTTIAVGAPGKDASVSLLNKSKVDAKNVLVALDVSKLKTDLVDIDETGCNPREDGWILCGIEGDTIRAGEDVDWFFPLTRKGKEVGPAGSITAVILHGGEDPDESDNVVTVDVKVEGTGPDLTVVADDVRKAVKVEGGTITEVGDLYAGNTGQLIYGAFNQGDQAARGLRIEVQLPKGATFAEKEPDCTYNAAMTSLTCEYDKAVLIPAAQDTDGDDLFSGARFYNLVKVADGVKPSSLTGGKVTIDSLSVQEAPSILRSAATSALPENATGVAGNDVDPSDNTDDFAVVVAAKGGSGGGDNGDGGGLPVTGVQVGLIGGVGAGVLAAGVAMFLVARRRRVVLVTPGDEKTNA
ncbi:cell wall anchor protein [Verrucosispora sioxanthis]|uniref:Cell wall anchor protein n=1 Tax=Verrucosispora sioxanthis TaxID=2499994 RepID=A0A6M1KU97_9ACTN|nr:cell wall anchor protein [Verrucosispora sioxanthis]NEE63525.1 cell wall anchor protein [Verrucosispora sioxanthis]NGM12635.1 cell wall anchor protein [Verrucosispora sioxanthis]